MGVKRRKKRGSVSAIGSPQRHKLPELRSRNIFEQVTYNGAANMPDIHLGVEAEPCMTDVPPTEPWWQPDNDSDILFNPSQMNVSVFDAGLDIVSPSNQMCCPKLTPELTAGWGNNLEGLDLPTAWDNPQYSEMASPSSQADSTGPSDASLSHDIPICPT